MSQRIETELRAVLEEASESIQPRADLADRVRRANRRRRHALTGVIAAGLAVVVAGGLIAFYGHGAAMRRPSTHHHVRKPPAWQAITTYGTPVAMAVSGRRLYVAVDDPGDSSLVAYDLRTGRLIRRISIPAAPSALRVGPDGLVWLAFYPDNTGGGTGVWLLSPNLKLRSGVNLGTRRYIDVTPFDVLPTSADTAILTAGQGLATLRLPPPGQPGRTILRWGPRIPGARQIHGVPVQLAAYAGRVAVRVDSDDAHGLITFPEPGSPEFRPSPADGVGTMAVGPSGLWTTLFTRNGDFGRGLIRLDGRLRPTTPRAISRNPLFAGAQQAAVLGSTVWVVVSRSPSTSPSLVCFADRGGQIGPVARIRTRAAPGVNADGGILAIVRGTVYVLGSGEGGVSSYRVPAACR